MSTAPTLTRSQERYLVAGSCLTAGLFGGWFARSIWTSRLQRISSVDQLVRLSTAPALRPVRLRGTVTRVGDADNFHLFHRPFWYRKPVPVGGKAIKAAGTVHVRLAGVDAPELAHFGASEQPYAREAHAWLTSRILNKTVTVDLYSKDRYGRVVGMVHRRKWLGLRRENVSAEFLKAGLATVYEQAGAVYGGQLDWFRRLEAKAKAAKRGMWAQDSKAYTSPAAFKAANKPK